MTAPELKPCPFCGADAELLGGPMSQDCYEVWCKSKQVRHHLRGTLDRDITVQRWNRRADLAAVPAQVRVKPTDAQINSACLSYRYDFALMETRDQDNLRFQANEWLIAWQKAARILDALEPQPAPRDEVIARLVEALGQFLIEYDEVDLAVPEPQSLISSVMEARAALAAAKAVQHG